VKLFQAVSVFCFSFLSECATGFSCIRVSSRLITFGVLLIDLFRQQTRHQQRRICQQ